MNIHLKGNNLYSTEVEPRLVKFTITEYPESDSSELLTFLANIEAWLSFNQEPTKVQLQELKTDIVKILEKHNFDYDSY